MTHCPACHQAFIEPASVPWHCPHCQRCVLGRYCDLQWIGGGGMGDVYRAIQPDMGARVVAIKIPKTSEPMLRSRFEREIAASARLEHPNIVRAYDRNDHAGWSYLVTEFVEGKLLTDLVQSEHPLPAGRVARLLAGVARGLAHAEGRGIVNRDIKPENILVDVKQDMAKILDYGLAHIADLDGNMGHVTRSGALLGTPSYMAPEQAKDAHGVTIAADVYSLGCTLFYCLVGRPPYLGPSLAELLHQHAKAPRPVLGRFRKDIPDELQTLLTQMMSVDPRRRPPPAETARRLEELGVRLGTATARSAPGADGMVETVCPSCGEVYRVRADTVGRSMPCPNSLCRRRFTIAIGGAASAPPGESRQAPPEVDAGLPLESFQQAFARSDGPVVLDPKQGTAAPFAEPPPVRFGPASMPEPHQATPVASIQHGHGAEFPPPSQHTKSPVPHAGQPAVAEPVVAEPVVADPPVGEAALAEPVTAAPVDCGAAADDVAVAMPAQRGVEPASDGWRSQGIEHLGASPAPRPPPAAPTGLPPPPLAGAEPVPLAGQRPFVSIPAGPQSGAPRTQGPEWGEMEVAHAVPVTSTGWHPPTAGDQACTPPIETAIAVPASADEPPSHLGEPKVAVPAGGDAAAQGPAARAGWGGVPPLSAASKPARARQTRNRKRSEQIVRGLVGAGVAAVVVLLAIVGYQQYVEYTKTPVQRWADAKKLYDDQSWTLARKEFQRFQRDYPDHPHAAQVPFFVDMCDAQAQTQSLTGDPVRGLALSKEIFKKHRDNPAYADYCADLYHGLERLVGSFHDRALARVGVRGRQQENKRALVEGFVRRSWHAGDLPGAEQEIRRAEEAHELLATIGRARTEHWVPQRTEELKRAIAAAKQIVQLAKACEEAAELLQPGAGGDLSAARFDEVYARLDALMQQHPELAASSELAQRRQRFELREPRRVKRAALSEAGAVAAAGPVLGNVAASVAVAWQDNERAPTLDVMLDASPPEEDRVVLALAHGVLYAFTRHGEFLWARRLGIDSYRLPQRFAASLVAPAMLIAVSTEDNSLVAMEEATGRLLWKFPAGGDLAAPPAIVHLYDGPNDTVGRVRGLLPTAEGDIRCLEIALGRELCRFHVGDSLTVAGAFNQDRENPLVYFPAASKRLYVIDPRAIDDEKRAPCVSVLYTGHAHGAVRNPPVVVERYLVLPEDRSLDEMTLVCYRLDKQGHVSLREAPRKREQIMGWSWFAPHVWPDRLFLVSDAGDVGLFGFNLDNPYEAVFRMLEPAPEVPPWQGNGSARSLAVYQDEHAVWAMVGGRLRKLAVNISEGKLQEVWPRHEPPAVEGIALHEAQTDEWGETLYVTHADPPGRQCLLTAVDAETGKRLWQRSLGLWPATEPLELGNLGAVVVDRCGRVCRLTSQSLSPPQAPRMVSELLLLEPSAHDVSADSQSGGIRLLAGSDALYLYHTNEQGNVVRVRPMAGEESAWCEIRFPAPLHGQPGVMAEHLVAACADGYLYRRRLDGQPLGVANEQPFQWELPSQIKQAPSHVVGLADASVLLADAGVRLRVLRLEELDGVQQWATDTSLILPAAMRGLPVVQDGQIYVADVQQRLHIMDGGLRASRQVQLSGRVTAGPVLRGEHVLVVLDQKRLAAVSAHAEEGGVVWETKSEWVSGRIWGLPPVMDGVLVVSDDYKLLSISLEDGSLAGSQRLPTRSFAATAAVPIGADQVAQPLADGTLVVMKLPGKEGLASRDAAPAAEDGAVEGEGHVP